MILNSAAATQHILEHLPLKMTTKLQRVNTKFYRKFVPLVMRHKELPAFKTWLQFIISNTIGVLEFKHKGHEWKTTIQSILRI
jgi:hypothetical protein